MRFASRTVPSIGRDQDPEELAQALLVLVGFFDQFAETRVEDPSDLPRQDRRQRHRQLDDLFEIGPAAFPVAVAERRRHPVGIVGEHIGEALKVGDRPHQLRAQHDIAIVQAIDLVDQDENASPGLVQCEGKLVPHPAEGVTPS